MNELYGSDAYAPAEIAQRVETVGVAKARLPLVQMVLLGVLAGAFIGLGAMFSLLVTSDPTLGFAASRVLGGLVFSLGLLLVVVAGAELFTGNNLLMMAWADHRISTRELLRNWVIVCLANFAGAAGLALLVYLSRHWEMNGGLVGEQTLRLAAAKCGLPLNVELLVSFCGSLQTIPKRAHDSVLLTPRSPQAKSRSAFAPRPQTPSAAAAAHP